MWVDEKQFGQLCDATLRSLAKCRDANGLLIMPRTTDPARIEAAVIGMLTMLQGGQPVMLQGTYFIPLPIGDRSRPWPVIEETGP